MADLLTTDARMEREPMANERAVADHLRTTDSEQALLAEELRGLAIEMHRRCYAHVPQWKPSTSPRGLLSQIDNMAAGMIERIGNLEAAISWIEPPFVDVKTPHDELKRRVEYVVEGAKRAVHGPRAA